MEPNRTSQPNRRLAPMRIPWVITAGSRNVPPRGGDVGIFCASAQPLTPMSRCVTCGAKTSQNKRTCSAICTRARKNRVSRTEQIQRDMDARPWGRPPVWRRLQRM